MKNKYASFYLIIILIFFSCSKDNNNSPITPTNAANVFIVGLDNDEAVYWQNGVEKFLPHIFGWSAVAVDIYVNGVDIHIIGFESIINNRNPLYWKNGSKTLLTSSFSSLINLTPNSISVNGSDVYISGIVTDTNSINPTNPPFYRNLPVYWQNGNMSILANDPNYNSYTTDIFSHGQDLYIAGGDGNGNAIYWKNGNIITLPHNSFIGAGTSDIYINGTDVLVSGTVADNTGNSLPVYWINGNLIQLPNTGMPNSSFETHSIFVSGSDIYVTGYSEGTNGRKALIWKNGVITVLASSYLHADTHVFKGCANGTDIYVSGTLATSGSAEAVYWKNGILNTLPSVNANSKTSAIVIN